MAPLPRSPDGPGRRAVLGGASLGITTLLLPTAAGAASVDGSSSGQTLQGFSVDDTGTPSVGDDVLIAVQLQRPDGSAYTSAADVTLRVRVDDGGGGGAGGHPTGLTVNGTTVTADAPTVTLAVGDGGTGLAEFSLGLPASGTYLLEIGTDPASLNHSTGVTLTLTHTA